MAVGDGVPREAGAPQPATAGAATSTTRGDRLAAALRDNLRRRKAQRRAATKAGGDHDAGPAVVGEGGGTRRERDGT
jgi:hypothetical protein